jgi:RHS repeat-associated protein
VVADTDGDVIKEILYDPVGGIIEDTNPGFRVPLGFAGGLHDRDLGFVCFGWRDYDPFTGRWTAPDPIGDRGGDPDWYGYCLDDPVNGVDPLGLASKKYAGADSEAGLSFSLGGLLYDSTKEQLDALDTDQMPRKRYNATSGRPGVNDPSKKNQGPIPPGSYDLDTSQITKNDFITRHFRGDWGKNRVPLAPSKETKTYGRSGFYLHGGSKPGSAGCVDAGSDEDALFDLLRKQKGVLPFNVK